MLLTVSSVYLYWRACYFSAPDERFINSIQCIFSNKAEQVLTSVLLTVSSVYFLIKQNKNPSRVYFPIPPSVYFPIPSSVYFPIKLNRKPWPLRLENRAIMRCTAHPCLHTGESRPQSSLTLTSTSARVWFLWPFELAIFGVWILLIQLSFSVSGFFLIRAKEVATFGVWRWARKLSFSVSGFFLIRAKEGVVFGVWRWARKLSFSVSFSVSGDEREVYVDPVVVFGVWNLFDPHERSCRFRCLDSFWSARKSFSVSRNERESCHFRCLDSFWSARKKLLFSVYESFLIKGVALFLSLNRWVQKLSFSVSGFFLIAGVVLCLSLNRRVQKLSFSVAGFFLIEVVVWFLSFNHRQ